MINIAKIVIKFAILLCIATPFTIANDMVDGYIWDQSNYLLKPGSRRNVENYSPMGQEFTPDSTILEIVQLHMHNYDTSPTHLSVNILADSITGTLVGSSSLTILPADFDGTATFLFYPVPLEPQHLYVFEIVLISGSAGVYGPSSGSPYPGGRTILSGVPYENIDLWFREGLLEGSALERLTWGSIKKSCF